MDGNASRSHHGCGGHEKKVITLDSLNYTNTATINGKTNFETLNAKETINAMSKHTSHNGFQLDGFKRLSVLSQTREEAEEILSSKLGEVLIPSIQTFYPDHRLIAFAACSIGNALRIVEQKDWNEEGICKYWKQLAGSILSIIPFHNTKKEVQSYCFYLLGGLLLREPKAETITYLKEKNFFGLMLMSYQLNYFDLWLWQNIATSYLHLLQNGENCDYLTDKNFHNIGRELLYSSSNPQIPPTFQPLFSTVSDFLSTYD